MKQKSQAALSKQIGAWNSHRKTGEAVLVALDNGDVKQTTTRSEAWIMGGHSAVILLEGVSGAYMLDRVKPLI